jgi:hypothetical protein
MDKVGPVPLDVCLMVDMHHEGTLRLREAKSISKSLPKFTWQILCFANF